MKPILRCRDLNDASATLAALYGVGPAELERALPTATCQAQRDPENPIGALPSALAAVLETTPAEPAMIHYFHGTRANDPERFLREGLRPLGQVLDFLWQEVAALVRELPEHEVSALRKELSTGAIGPHTYGLRIGADQQHHGPCGHLLREMFLDPDDYASVDYLAGAEIVIDICEAIEERTGIDATARYRHSTTPCLIEFAVPTSYSNGALAAALWYLAAGLRGERTANGNWSYCGDGVPLPPQAIISVLDPQEISAGNRGTR